MLSYSDWVEKFGKQHKVARGYSVDYNRSSKIAATKNRKIEEENRQGYVDYISPLLLAGEPVPLSILKTAYCLIHETNTETADTILLGVYGFVRVNERLLSPMVAYNVRNIASVDPLITSKKNWSRLV